MMIRLLQYRLPPSHNRVLDIFQVWIPTNCEQPFSKLQLIIWLTIDVQACTQVSRKPSSVVPILTRHSWFHAIQSRPLPWRWLFRVYEIHGEKTMVLRLSEQEGHLGPAMSRCCVVFFVFYESYLPWRYHLLRDWIHVISNLVFKLSRVSE